jgi:hypothetical protein
MNPDDWTPMGIGTAVIIIGGILFMIAELIAYKKWMDAKDDDDDNDINHIGMC